MLPFVTNEVGHALAHAIDSNVHDMSLIKKELKKIKEKNPAIAQWITKWAKICHSRSGRIHAAYCGIYVYKLLESQAEADDMERDLRLD